MGVKRFSSSTASLDSCSNRPNLCGQDQLNPMKQPTRILIVDDHYVVRQGLKQIIAEQLPVVEFGEASNGNEALELVWNKEWDVLLLDVVMSGRGGLDTMKEVHRSKPDLPVIILSMQSASQFAVRAIKLGAFAYIQKDSAGLELIEAVQAALLGQKYITPFVAELMAREMMSGNGRLAHQGLSDREYQVLCLLGSGQTVKEIGARFSLSAKTISTYRTRILGKMGLKNNAQITHYVVKNGLTAGKEEE